MAAEAERRRCRRPRRGRRASASSSTSPLLGTRGPARAALFAGWCWAAASSSTPAGAFLSAGGLPVAPSRGGRPSGRAALVPSPPSGRGAGRRAESELFARKRKNVRGGGGGGGFGGGGAGGIGKQNPPENPPKYTMDDKSYDLSPPTDVPSETLGPEEESTLMAEFFEARSEWRPLFDSLAKEAEDEDFDPWDLAALEGRRPWRLLPPRPQTNSSLEVVSEFLDEWQRSLLDIPLDALITGKNDAHFLEEGRRTIAVTRFHVLDEHHGERWENAVQRHQQGGAAGAGTGTTRGMGGAEAYDWEEELFRTCWSELAHLSAKDECDTGSLILLPRRVRGSGGGRGLDRVKSFVEHNLMRPMRWMGRGEDWEIVAMERGSLAVRMLYKLSEMPDLKERDRGNDEEVGM